MRVPRNSLCAALIVLAAATAHGQITHEFTFDDVATGSPANALPQPGALSLAFDNAAFLPDVNEFGDPIPGTERWRPDPFAPLVIVDDPNNYDRGNAPSPVNALEALFQPVLLTFLAPFNFDPGGFSLILDLDPFGINGTLPGNEDIGVHFFGAGGSLLQRIPIDQTTPGFIVATGGQTGVHSILLPAGAFYDNLHISGIPEPATGLLVLVGMSLLRRRR